MEGKRLIGSIKLTNLLSFGPDGMEIELQPLNVLIGANGSGKSNFIEAFRVLNATTTDLSKPFVGGGGVDQWIWKGESSAEEVQIQVIIQQEKRLCSYMLSFSSVGARPYIRYEQLQSFSDKLELKNARTFYSFKDGSASVLVETGDAFHDRAAPQVTLEPSEVKTGQSTFVQQRRGLSNSALTYVNQLFNGFSFYADYSMGKASAPRRPQDAALDSGFLFEDASNLALVINELQTQPQVMRTIIEKLKLFYERVENIITRVQGGTVQIYFQERGLQQTVPATRLSDGTLRFLCLLVILLHPSPPPLICIEEPELGMHPDIIGTIAELLVEASQRTQLIVTTHSDLLISKLTDIPEAVVVCERGRNGTSMQRLDAKSLEVWLKEYTLGEVWLKGGIGGTRW